MFNSQFKLDFVYFYKTDSSSDEKKIVSGKKSKVCPAIFSLEILFKCYLLFTYSIYIPLFCFLKGKPKAAYIKMFVHKMGKINKIVKINDN